MSVHVNYMFQTDRLHWEHQLSSCSLPADQCEEFTTATSKALCG